MTEEVTLPLRVMLAKVGLDGHDRGVKIVARWLRDAGMDVVYTGLHHTPEQVVEAAVQEDVDVLGVSVLSGAHMSIFPRLIELLSGYEDVAMALVAGGVIPDEDAEALKKQGVDEILGQDSMPEDVVGTVQRVVQARTGDISACR